AHRQARTAQAQGSPHRKGRRPMMIVPTLGQRIERAAGHVVLRGSDQGESARTMRFVASDESVDRSGDIIRASGWQLDNFRKNPVFLWAHKSSEPPIGKVTSIGVERTQLMADVELAAAGTMQRA